MKIYKFFIPTDKWFPDPEHPELTYQGCVAATVAESVADARENLIHYGATNGLDVGWLRAARVAELPIQAGTVIAWAQL